MRNFKSTFLKEHLRWRIIIEPMKIIAHLSMACAVGFGLLCLVSYLIKKLKNIKGVDQKFSRLSIVEKGKLKLMIHKKCKSNPRKNLECLNVLDNLTADKSLGSQYFHLGVKRILITKENVLVKKMFFTTSFTVYYTFIYLLYMLLYIIIRSHHRHCTWCEPELK